MAGTPKKTPAKSPMKAKSPSPKSAKKSAVKSPKSAKKSPVKTPKKTPAKTPVKSPKVQKAIEKDVEKKARKVKKVKDENAPKRAQSAYFLWLNANRADIIKQYGLDATKVAEIAKKAGEVWKTMSEEQKKPYDAMAAKDKARYEKEKEGYVPDPAVAVSKGKKTKTKDPDAPKKATTGYFCFLNSNRAKILKDFSLEGKKASEVAAKAGELWGRLSEAEKKPYMDEAAKDKVRYDNELAAYNQKLAAA